MTAHLHPLLLLDVGLVLTVAGIVFGFGWEARGCWAESRVSRLADLAPMPVELPSYYVLRESYGPFPVDTGPLLLLSEKDAANAAHEREVRAMILAAEQRIGPVR